MSQFHKPRDKSKHSEICQTCFEQESRYIHKDVYLCRECMDKEEYPHLAHLTQQEREDMRAQNLVRVKGGKPSIINASNLAELSKIGFTK